MSTWRRAFPRPVALFCLVVLLGQAVLVAMLLRSTAAGRPHDVPVAVVAPAVVAGPWAARVNDLAGRPFDPVVVDGRSEALQAVVDGAVVAALQVDLTGTRDELVVHEAQDARFNEAVVSQVRAIERSQGRTVEVAYVGPDGLPADGQGDAAANAYDLTLAASLAGFFMVLVVSLWRGPVARNLRLGVARVLGLGLLAVGVGAALAVLPTTAVDADLVAVAGLTALAVAVAAVITLASEAVAGLAGLALTATLFLVVATSLLTRTNAYLLPQPWRALMPWTAPGALLDEVTRLASFGPSGTRRSLLVLVAWLVLGVVTLLVSRRVRGRYGVDLDGEAPRPTRPAAEVGPWRLRVATVAVPVGVLLLAAVSLVPLEVVEAAPLSAAAVETSCVDLGEPRTVKDLNRLTTGKGTPEFEGGDVGAEVRLQDGRRLWVFGDTLRGSEVRGPHLVRNSMLLTDPRCLRVVLPADGGAPIPARADGVGYWPMSVARSTRPGYDLVLVTAQRVRATGPGQWDFEILGPALALFVVPRGEIPQLAAVEDIGPDVADRSQPVWGAAAAMDGSWVYLYGTATPGAPYVFGSSLQVARVDVDDVFDEGAWRYWDGGAWGTDPDAAAELIPAVGGVSQTLSVFEVRGTWYALSQRNDFLGGDVVAWTAPSATGPFDGGESLAALSSDLWAGELNYMPLAHPDLLPRPGTVVVSYSRNSSDAGSVFEDPLRYRIRFLRVELP
jgi:hypothetical protein